MQAWLKSAANGWTMDAEWTPHNRNTTKCLTCTFSHIFEICLVKKAMFI